ncbi:MAG: hypothetical protein RLZZ200_1897, partial [Pseudomonadota bacterium]
MNRPVTSALLLLMATFTAAALPAAESLSRYTLSAAGLQLEVSAPRADILRIRAARGKLGEDASWAIAKEQRAANVPLKVSQSAGQVTVSTDALRLELDRRSMHLRVVDRAGKVLLEDAKGTALRFDDGASAGPAPTLRFAMPDDAHYFGLGDKSGPLDRRGQSFVLWNTDASEFSSTTDPLYKAIPFLLIARETGEAAGLLVDTTWRSSFDFGRRERDTLVIGAEGGAIDYYVMAGPAPKDIVRSYAWLTGTPPLPPLWALGFHQSRYSYLSATEAGAIADRMRAEHIPADALWLDIDYQQNNRPFTVNHATYPDMPGFVAKLAKQDMKLVLITDMHIAHLPGQGYAPYDSGLARGLFVRRPDGTPAVEEVWPGLSVFPDFTRPAAREWWGSLYADFVNAGVAGFWNDMNEPAIFKRRDKTLPPDSIHRIEEPGFVARDVRHAEAHNIYGMQNTRATFDGLLKLRPEERPFVLTRASYAGGHRYAATWTGDNSSTWEHLRFSVPQLVNLGLSGFSLAGADVGGFTGYAASPELLTRWFQVGAFTPLFRDHADKSKPPQEPWVDGEAHTAIRKRFVEERYRLLPYLYALAEENSRSGIPMMRPVFLEFPSLLTQPEALWYSQDQFMLGADLLVAPPPNGESPGRYSIRLPAGGWYDYWNGRRIEGVKLATTPKLEELPVFVRAGAILPRQPVVQSTAQRLQGALQLDVYVGPDCRGALYLDDGHSFAYRKGDFLRQAIRCEATGDSVTVQFQTREGRYVPWWSGIELRVHGLGSAPSRMSRDGQGLDGSYDAAQDQLRVTLPD